MFSSNFLKKEELSIIKNLNFNLCLQCGKCTAGCPSFQKAGLNPRILMRKVLYLAFPLKIHPSFSLSEIDDIWTCTTCNNCVIRCPRDAKPMETILAFRTILVERGAVPSRIREILENIYRLGNPFGISGSKRIEWARDLNIKKVSSEDKITLLYFTGCITSYNCRAQSIARSLALILKNLGIDFSILAEEESCCGNEVYSLGERGLFEILMEKNAELFQRYNTNEIITTCPHCFNALRNMYKLNGVEVRHHTQFLADLIDKGVITFSESIERRIAFHDPCYLGRYNNIFEEPRKILENIPGVTLLELEHSRKNSFCCGCGGGKMWYESPVETSRPSEDRIREAIEAGVEILTVACPFCLSELEDAVKKMGCENKLKILDVIEIVHRAMNIES